MKKKNIFKVDFNMFLECPLDAKKGSPLFKLIEVKGKWNLCNIWRVRYSRQTDSKLRLQHFSTYSAWTRLDFNISKFPGNDLKIAILGVISLDHSLVSCSVQKNAKKGGISYTTNKRKLCGKSALWSINTGNFKIWNMFSQSNS